MIAFYVASGNQQLVAGLNPDLINCSIHWCSLAVTLPAL